MKLLLIILLGLLSLQVAAETPSANTAAESFIPVKITASTSPKRVLFVGNSFSFYNNGIHNHLGSLIRAAGDWQRGENRLRLSTLSGAQMSEHLPDLTYLLSQSDSRWDAVVLQGHSNEPITKSKQDDFIQATLKAIKIAKENQIEPILFMTWAYKHQPNMLEPLANAYIELANKNQVMVVPVGLAFAEAQKRLPQIELFVPDVLGVEQKDTGTQLRYRKDWKHPSQAGTYLAACTFYSALYRTTPEGLIFKAGLEDDEAQALQALSWEVVSQFYDLQRSE